MDGSLQRRGPTSSALLIAVFVALTLALCAALVVQFADAWGELGQARRAASLASADRALFQGTQTLRVSRGETQTAIMTTDQPTARVDELLAGNEKALAASLAAVDRSLSTAAPELIAEIGRRRDAAVATDRLLSEQEAKPKAERDLKAIQPWYDAVGAVTVGLTALSNTIAAEARMADPVIGENVLARQYSWAIRDSIGGECSFVRDQFSKNEAPPAKMLMQVARMRGAAERSLAALEDLLARPGAPKGLITALGSAKAAVTKAIADRDKIYDGLGKPGATSPTEWQTVCSAAFAPILTVADAAIAGMAARAAERQSAAVWSLAVIGAALVAAVVGCGAGLFLIRRRVVMPVQLLTAAIARLAQRDFVTAVPASGRADEFGAMATTLEALREGALEAEGLAAERIAEQASRVERSGKLEGLVRSFETKVGELVGLLAAASTELEATAQSMSSTAGRTDAQASTVATAAEQASAGVQTVAAAAEELSSSIAEIARQVSQSTRITQRAVEDARRTDTIVRALADSAQRIGDVVGLISTIAGQTNLLALNATIEAARAGDAGKGFAVVASEVKSLANQTASATGEIGAQVEQIQAATREAVEAIQTIGSTIEEVSAIAGAIAAAVEEQGAATAEIARNVQQTAASTNAVTSNIAGVSQAANETGAAASEVLDSAGQLSRQAEELSREVNGFVAGVRGI
jgi:methyl-accepting chemotaxis protein